jgi:hypothetical protein
MTQYRRRKKEFTVADMREAFRDVARLARREGKKVALAGGLAMRTYGSDRVTQDVDVLASETIDRLARGRLLSFGGVQTRTRMGVPVDLIVRSDEYADLYEEALDRAVNKGGLRIVRPEHLVSMKMVAGRARDESDLMFLLSRMDAAMFKRALDVARRFLGRYAARELTILRQEARWRREAKLL